MINGVAALVSPKHKVNLGNPDKVILIEIYKVRLLLSLALLKHKPRLTLATEPLRYLCC